MLFSFLAIKYYIHIHICIHLRIKKKKKHAFKYFAYIVHFISISMFGEIPCLIVLSLMLYLEFSMFYLLKVSYFNLNLTVLLQKHEVWR